MADFVHLKYEVVDSIAEISFQRPPVNALSLEMIGEIVNAVNLAAADANVRAVIFASGIARRFCAGLDLNLILDQPSDHIYNVLKRLYIDLYDAQYKLGKPSIAAVNGAARGGGMTVAVSCDVVIASEQATFGYPEIELGLIPGIHFVHLPRIVGRHRAFELLFSGRSFPASEAQSLGIVSQVVPGDAVMSSARTLARSFAAKSPTVMRLGRAAFMRANDLDYRRSIENVVDSFCTIAGTDDAREGLRAFKDGRKPNWQEV
ncbi:enoyl-CoA hydratase/isomerase family protein [Bradyrhizobium sp. AS23.2]|uniref:enoyl-CoA hydratase/isomerase family protein n=1 Tax=Bradyrhizobium sp. AS23.2 TaxID=1680155 RepID=UPI00093E74C7|nr:enoyl-CoA hydratase/isomerase family protein [Bradyrhizobium sp. AS23.2]OKO81315.1 enoyl-CoA hydratase [Bradyrhizobium sp. AS23.2]